MMTIETTATDPRRVQPWHEVRDEQKLADLATSMQANGWVGAPIVVLPGEDLGWGAGCPRAITGSHRLEAAIEADIDVPTVDLDTLLAEHGTSLAELVEEYGDEYEAIIRLDYHLPAEIVDYYGLDAH